MHEIMETIRQEVTTLVRLDSSGHNLDHLERVYRLSMRLAQVEGGNRLVVGAAAWLHDLHRVIEAEAGTLGQVGQDILAETERILERTGFPRERIPAVLLAIADHDSFSFGNGRRAPSLEAILLQDADKLDAMGAIGIARCFQFSGAHANPLWDGQIPEPGPYDPTRNTGTALGHFYEKLLRLQDDLQTPTARALGIERHRFMEQFVARFQAEWRAVDHSSEIPDA
ncbi:MAG: HD domain-containing protein [Chloroflexi bacterium]|nr:HD domain-containing protein [Chloroflexota bacterium]